MAEIDKLREAASERWDDRWTIETREWADGSTQSIAFHSHGRVEDGDLLEREVMQYDGDDLVVWRERIPPQEPVVTELVD